MNINAILKDKIKELNTLYKSVLKKEGDSKFICGQLYALQKLAERLKK